MAHAILDVVAEDPECQQVAADMHVAAVHEHRREHRGPTEVRGDQSSRKVEVMQVGRGQQQFVQKNDDVEADQRQRDKGRRS